MFELFSSTNLQFYQQVKVLKDCLRKTQYLSNLGDQRIRCQHYNEVNNFNVLQQICILLVMLKTKLAKKTIHVIGCQNLRDDGENKICSTIQLHSVWKQFSVNLVSLQNLHRAR